MSEKMLRCSLPELHKRQFQGDGNGERKIHFVEQYAIQNLNSSSESFIP